MADNKVLNHWVGGSNPFRGAGLMLVENER